MLSDPKWDEKVEVELDDASLHLLRAIDYIEKHGWCQGTSFGPNDTVCIWGALYRTKTDTRLYFKASNRLRQLIGDRSIPNWNDAKGRTKEEVIAKLREAAYLGK